MRVLSLLFLTLQSTFHIRFHSHLPNGQKLKASPFDETEAAGGGELSILSRHRRDPSTPSAPGAVLDKTDEVHTQWDLNPPVCGIQGRADNKEPKEQDDC